MIPLPKCRRFRLSLLFACLIVLAAAVYAVLNVLSDASNRQRWNQRQQRELAATDQVMAIAVTSNHSGSSSHSPLPLASLKLVRKSSVVDEVTDSPTPLTDDLEPRGENSTDDKVDVDTGVEREGRTLKPHHPEKSVRREVRRLRLRPPKTVQFAHGQWQVVDIGRQVIKRSSAVAYTANAIAVQS